LGLACVNQSTVIRQNNKGETNKQVRNAHDGLRAVRLDAPLFSPRQAWVNDCKGKVRFMARILLAKTVMKIDLGQPKQEIIGYRPSKNCGALR